MEEQSSEKDQWGDRNRDSFACMHTYLWKIDVAGDSCSYRDNLRRWWGPSLCLYLGLFHLYRDLGSCPDLDSGSIALATGCAPRPVFLIV